jgi:hypothetical protein
MYVCALLLKKKWRFSNLKFDIKRERTRKHVTLTPTKREREKERAHRISLSVCVSVSLFLSLSVRVCSEVIYKKRDVSIDDDQQCGGTR